MSVSPAPGSSRSTNAAPASPRPDVTIADLLRRLGGVPARRVRVNPAPGQAGERDLLRVLDRENRICELVDGTLVEKPMRFDESEIGVLISYLILSHARPRKLGVVTGSDGMYRLFPGLVRAPDVAYTSWKRMPGRKRPTEPIPSLVPDLVIEILSKGNTRAEVKRKLGEYFEAGVQAVWIVDPLPHGPQASFANGVHPARGRTHARCRPGLARLLRSRAGTLRARVESRKRTFVPSRSSPPRTCSHLCPAVFSRHCGAGMRGGGPRRSRSFPEANPVRDAIVSLVLAIPAVADEPRIRRDIPYADPKNERQLLDVYAPGKGQNHPIVFWIHGGGWVVGSKTDVALKPRWFVDQGFVFASSNYRFVPQVTIKQIAGDLAKSIRWVHEHAAEFGGDPNTFFIMGHSAGAQLAALLATDESYLKAEGLSLTMIKGCVPVDGDTYDVLMQIRTVEQRRKDAYRFKFGDEEHQKDLSPVTHVASGKSIPPFLILHVEGHPETTAQSNRLVAALREAGVEASVYPSAGKNHNTLNDDLGKPGDEPTKALLDFMQHVLTQPGSK